eukprot:TRINITY_DN22278_c0_g1_i1.p1 TRINITY_DN22278_c0_g1~~TRINITY_DN22278_c0_g1_i1.p1  ORF type:complete len:585 (+),score=53.54 TRINITY_DN22278_c0_g1_i1:77-1756(+)
MAMGHPSILFRRSSLLSVIVVVSLEARRYSVARINDALGSVEGDSKATDLHRKSSDSLAQRRRPLTYEDERACPIRRNGAFSDLYEFYVKFVKVTWPTSETTESLLQNLYDRTGNYQEEPQRLRALKSRLYSYYEAARNNTVQYYFSELESADWRELRYISPIGSLQIREVMISGKEHTEEKAVRGNISRVLLIEHYKVPKSWAAERFRSTGQTAMFRAMVARGAFGSVYLASHKESKEVVAVKEIHKRAVTRFDWVEVAVARKSLAYNIGIQNVFYHRMNETLDAVKLVYQYVKGMDLYDHFSPMFWSRKLFPIDDIRRILAQITWGVLALHRHKIVHRDLKLENVMIRSDTLEVTIIDYGAALMDCDEKDGCEGDHAGTLTYMSPDVLQGKYGFEVDWYSVGVMAYLLTMRAFPWDIPRPDVTAREYLQRREKAEAELKLGLRDISRLVDGSDREKKALIDFMKLLITTAGRKTLRTARRKGTLSMMIAHSKFWYTSATSIFRRPWTKLVSSLPSQLGSLLVDSPLLAYMRKASLDLEPINHGGGTPPSICYEQQDK